MPSFSGQVVNGKIILNVGVGPPQGPPGSPSGVAHWFKALIDTGATISAISSQVVEVVGLESSEWEDITGVHGTQSTAIQTPFHKVAPMLRVAELAMDSAVTGYDVLLGMDFLRLFHLTLYNDTFILSN